MKTRWSNSKTRVLKTHFFFSEKMFLMYFGYFPFERFFQKNKMGLKPQSLNLNWDLCRLCFRNKNKADLTLEN